MKHTLKSFVCGASGYLGGNLCDYLLREGHPVTGVDVKAWPGKQYDHFTFLQADLSEPASYQSLVEGIDDDTIIFFLTGLSGTARSFDHYAKYVAANELSLLHLLDSLRARGTAARVILHRTPLVGQIS